MLLYRFFFYMDTLGSSRSESSRDPSRVCGGVPSTALSFSATKSFFSPTGLPSSMRSMTAPAARAERGKKAEPAGREGWGPRGSP